MIARTPSPTLGSTLYERIFNTSSNDVNITWRKDPAPATLSRVSADPVRGLGFGPTRTDFLLTIWTLMLLPAAVSSSGGARHYLGRLSAAARVDPVRR